MLKKICVISYTHGLYDDRVYYKEALSLNKSYEITCLTMGDIYKEGKTSEGIPYYIIPRQLVFNNFYINLLFRIFGINITMNNFFRILQKNNPDVIHIHDIQLISLAKIIRKKMPGTKIIYDVHEYYPDLVSSNLTFNHLPKFIKSFIKRFISYWELKHSKHIHHFCPVSEFVASRFQKKFGSHKVTILYNYTNLELEEERIHSSSKIYDLVYCGNINEERGIWEILEAVRQYCKIDKSVKVILIGKIQSENLQVLIAKFIEENGLENNIIIQGKVPYDQVKELLLQSRIGMGLFRPSWKFYYGIQVKTFEYMAFGLPIICSNFGNMYQYVKNNKCGVGVDIKSIPEITEAIEKLLKDHNVYKEYSINAIKAQKTLYSWKREENKMFNAYSSLLK